MSRLGKFIAVLTAIMLITVGFAGCSQQATPASSASSSTQVSAEAAASTAASDSASPAASEAAASSASGLGSTNITPLKDDGSGVILSLGNQTGPNGETAVGVEAILNLISDEKKEEIRNAGYTAAVSLYTTDGDWPRLESAGIQAVLDEYNIKLLTTTDAQVKADKQVSDLESIIAMKPSMIISFVLDAKVVGPELQEASAQGIKVALIDAVPSGFTSPQDYAGMATSDNYANGAAAAQKLVDYLGEKGNIAILKYTTSLFHTDARTQGAMDVFAKYPNIKIVAEQGVSDAPSAATATEAILTAHPDIKGIWAIWDTPAMGAAGVIENMGKQNDIKVVTCDLNADSAYDIASGGAILATGAQHPYDQGVAQAMIGVGALAGVETPSYVIVPGEIVTRDTLKASWDRIFKTTMPDNIADALNQ